MKTFVGIDVAKAHVDLYDTVTNNHVQFKNDLVGISECTDYLGTLDPKLVVMENTGGYETSLAVALQSAGLPVAVITTGANKTQAAEPANINAVIKIKIQRPSSPE